MKNKNFNSSRQNFISNGNNKHIKNEKLRNILSWLLIGILCFTIIGSVLGTIAFGKTHTASADTVTSEYIYEGKNIFVPTTSAYPKINDYTYSISFLSVDLKLEKSHFYLHNAINVNKRIDCYLPSLKLYLDSRYYPLSLELPEPLHYGHNGANAVPDENGFVSVESYMPYFQLFNKGSDGSSSEVNSIDAVTNNTFVLYHLYPYYDDAETSGFLGYYGYITYECQIGFNGDVYSVKYSSSSSESVKFYRIFNTLTYRDKNGYTCEISFRSTVSKSTVRTGYISWEDRIYYLSNAFDDNTLYDEGLKEGYDKGKYDGVVQYKDSNQFSEDAHDKFYNKFIEEYKESSSFKTLIEQAKESGRMEERAEGSNVTFTNTLSAMYNAPLGAFRDFLNFELLGINMLGFFTGLFTIAFVLFVIKKLT